MCGLQALVNKSWWPDWLLDFEEHAFDSLHDAEAERGEGGGVANVFAPGATFILTLRWAGTFAGDENKKKKS